jgi:tetratricopeptide (TPR) repeat protein
LYADQQRWNEAIGQYQEAIRLEPKFSGAYWKLAGVFQQVGQASKATECWYRALQLEPDWAAAPEHMRLGKTLVKQGKLSQAERCYHQVVHLDPAYAEAYFALGEVKGSQGKWQEALSYYAQATEYEPENQQFHYGLGKALTAQGRWDEAAACFERTIALEPDGILGYLELRHAWVKLNRWQTMMQNTQLQQGLGRALAAQERWDEAIACYQRLLSLEPTIEHYEMVRDILLKLERWEEALPYCRKIAQLQPDSGQAFHVLGDAFNKVEQWEKAVKAFRHAIRLNPEFSWSYNNLGTALIQLEQWEEAVAALQQAIALNPDFHWSHYNLGDAFVELEQLDGAIAAYQQALALEPNLPQGQQKLANVLYQRAKADLEKALSGYRAAIAQDPEDLQSYHGAIAIQPNDPLLYQDLGDALTRKGKSEGAMVFYDLAKQLSETDSKKAVSHLLREEMRLELPTRTPSSRSSQGVAPVLPLESLQPIATDVRLIAFYLPQFHPIPENDQWWGKGFTEWTNVSKAQPLFAGHHQPHLPADLGFYDLRVADVREAQAALAKRYGIHGFCYYYYWFAGKRLLHRPLDEVLASQQPDFPFCICWANENWTRRWDGQEQEVLMAQDYSPEQNQAFAESLIPILMDKRYIRVGGAPLLIVYRADILPDAIATLQQWRQVFRANGVGEVHICAALTFGLTDPTGLGFDSGVQFPPHGVSAQQVEPVEVGMLDFTGNLYPYEEAAINALSEKMPNYPLFPGVMTSWDNTARRGKAGNIFLNSHPDLYEFWLKGAIEKVKQNTSDHQLVFINAWNEWAEGAHLEPDRQYGHGYLLATYQALNDTHSWQTALGLLRYLPIEDIEQRQQLLAQLARRVEAKDRSLKAMAQYLQQAFAQTSGQLIDIIRYEDQASSWYLETPQIQAKLNIRAIAVRGWALNQTSPVVAIQVAHNGELKQTLAMNETRADVAKSYSGLTELCGFNSQVLLDIPEPEFQINLSACLENGQVMPLGALVLKQLNQAGAEAKMTDSQRQDLEDSQDFESWKRLMTFIKNASAQNAAQLKNWIDELEQCIIVKTRTLDCVSHLLRSAEG